MELASYPGSFPHTERGNEPGDKARAEQELGTSGVHGMFTSAWNKTRVVCARLSSNYKTTQI